ncbi:MAG: DUF3289 family protein [Fibromonadaceae bacterium]|jgi:hypothetical protein|nr:DUF3289 family protein [Fibromonadaceae bacterium]
MEYYVNKRAKLKCPWGSEQPELEVVHIGDPVILCGELMANIADNKPMANIKPFGQCSSLANPAVAAATSANYGRLQKMPCVPITPSPWLGGKMDLIINGSPALLSTCKCACSWSNGRLIEIADPGQDSVYVGGPMTITITEPTLETRQALGSGLQSSQGALVSGFQASGSGASTEAGTSTESSPLLIKKVEGAAETYPRQKIVYKVTEYSKNKSEMSEEDKNKEIKWAVKAGSNVTRMLEDRGEKITLDIDPGWEYKDILVMAYINSYSETVSQKTKVLQDPYGSTLIRGVVGEDEALVGQDVEYSVTNSNKDGSASKVNDGSNVKWAIKVGKDGGIDKEALKDMRGKKAIVLKMKSEWEKEGIITVMPYMNSPTETVSVKTKIENKFDLPKMIIETKRIEGKEKEENGTRKTARDMYFGLKAATHPHTGRIDSTGIVGNFNLEQEIYELRFADLRDAIRGDLGCNDDELFRRFKELVKYTSMGVLENANLKLIDKMRELKSTRINADKFKKPEEYSHPDIANAVLKHEETGKFRDKVKNYAIKTIKEIIRDHNGNINNINTVESDIDRPQYSGKIDMFCGLKIAINDTWGHRAEIVGYEYDTVSRKFKARLKIRIFDHFGLDYDDIKKFGTAELARNNLPDIVRIAEYVMIIVPQLRLERLALEAAIRYLMPKVAGGFRAWFILQHYRGYRPFVNIIEEEITIEG